MNEMNTWMSVFFDSLVTQALIDKNKWQILPQDQREALEKIKNAFHDIIENKGKILPQYQKQALEEIALKIASEMNLHNGGYPR